MDIKRYENPIFLFVLISLLVAVFVQTFVFMLPSLLLLAILSILWLVRYRPGITTEMRLFAVLMLTFALIVTIAWFPFPEAAIPFVITALLAGLALLGLGSAFLIVLLPWLRVQRAVRTEGGVGELIAALHNPDPAYRREAATQLGYSKSVLSILPLTAALQDSEADVKRAALMSLDRMRQFAVPWLLAAVQEPRNSDRCIEIAALGQLGDSRAITPLRTAISDPDSDVREFAAVALGHLAESSAIPLLIARLRDEVPDVRAAAAWALGELQAADALPMLQEIV